MLTGGHVPRLTAQARVGRETGEAICGEVPSATPFVMFSVQELTE